MVGNTPNSVSGEGIRKPTPESPLRQGTPEAEAMAEKGAHSGSAKADSIGV